MTKKFLTRADILKADDLPTRDVDVPEWDGTVRVRSMTAGDRDAFDAAVAEAQKEGGLSRLSIRARYAAACIVDEQGNPLFKEADVEALARKSGAAMDRVIEAISELNKLSPDDIEATAKN